MIRFLVLLLASVTFSTAAHAWGGSYCARDARAIARSYGGHSVQLNHSGVRGWGVNASGYVSYTYLLGDQECYVSFFVSGTYFGAICKENYGMAPADGKPTCGKVGTWTAPRFR